MRIAIDIDSTLHHYWDQFSDVVRRRFDVDLPYEGQQTWAITRLEPEQVHAAVLETHSPPLVAAAVPYPGAVETVNAWHAAGHFIHITSHRSTAEPRRDRRLAGRDRPARTTSSTARSTRSPAAARSTSTCSIDDSPVNLERALEEGIVGATIAHPWNRELIAARDVIAADDWPGLEAAARAGARGPAR